MNTIGKYTSIGSAPKLLTVGRAITTFGDLQPVGRDDLAAVRANLRWGVAVF